MNPFTFIVKLKLCYTRSKMLLVKTIMKSISTYVVEIQVCAHISTNALIFINYFVVVLNYTKKRNETKII